MIQRIREQYKWVIVAACFLMVAITLGFCSSTKPLYLSAITGALGIERSLFSINDSFRYVTTTIVNLFFGTLIGKFGARKLIAAGFISLAASMVVYSVAETLPLFYLGGILLGLGFSWTTTTMVGSVIGVWCKENKGTIMGAVLAANGLGGAVAAQVVGPLISGASDGFGYRTAYMVTALILLAVGLLVVAVFRNRPDGTTTTVPAKKTATDATWSGVSLEECLRAPYFYCVCICVFLTGFALQGIYGIYKAHMNDVGIPDDYSTLIVSVHSLTIAGCKFLTGWIHDKKGLRFTVIICDIAAVVMVLLLALSAPTAFGMTCAMGYGIVSSVALPLETVMLPLIAATLFGEKDFVKILGVLVSANSAGYALGAPLCNLVFDITGSYHFCFYIMGALIIFVTVLFQLVLRAAKRRQSMAAEANT
jgi:MFS family permease